jgi:hypothetical protein
MASSYYPQRARWYSRIFAPWFIIRRVLHLERLYFPEEISASQFFWSLIVPGYSFFACGRKFAGRVFLAAYCLAAIVFVVALGYSAAGIAYGLMIAAHASSLCFLELRWLSDRTFGQRIGLALITVIVVGLLIYIPLISYLERHWLTPLRMNGYVVIVGQSAAPVVIRRGDWVAYNLRPNQEWHFNGRQAHGVVYVRAGVDLGPVLAIAGDQVEFTTNAFLVNGVSHPLLPHMATSGELIVPQKHWFIWPGIDITGRADAATVSTAVMNNALVSEEQFVGRPFKWWFWRRQTLQRL